MLQTTSEIGGQVTRKTLDWASGVATGFALAKGIITEDMAGQLVIIIPALLTMVGNWTWWKKAQRKVVTADGLEAAGKTAAAASVEAAVKAVKKAAK